MKYRGKKRENTKDKEDIIMKWYRKPCNPANVPHYTKDQTKRNPNQKKNTTPCRTWRRAAAAQRLLMVSREINDSFNSVGYAYISIYLWFCSKDTRCNRRRPPHMANRKRKKNSKSNQRPSQRLAEHEKKTWARRKKHDDGKSGKLVSVILINGCNNSVWKGPVWTWHKPTWIICCVPKGKENKGDGEWDRTREKGGPFLIT